MVCSENLECEDNNERPTYLCSYPSPSLPHFPAGLIAVAGHNFPLFEMLERERSWLFNNHFRLNSGLRRAAESLLAEYRLRTSCLIGVHIRRTDYKKLLGEKAKWNNSEL